MNILCYKTRQWLINANRSEFNDIIYQAKLTPRQTHIVYRKFIDCYSICKISQEVHLTEAFTKTTLSKAYDLIGKLLVKNNLISV